MESGDPVANNRITVCIRKRPLSSKEEKAKDVDVVTVASRDYVTIRLADSAPVDNPPV